MDTVAESWAKIEAWLAANAPAGLLAALGPPATDTAIAETEAALGVRLPKDVREFYRIHDGGLDVDGWQFSPLAGVVQYWRMMHGLLSEGVFRDWRSAESEFHRSDWWHPKWIGLASTHSGGTLSIDLAPGKKGVPGQVFAWWNDDTNRHPGAESLRAWLVETVTDLESGELVYDEEYDAVVPWGHASAASRGE